MKDFVKVLASLAVLTAVPAFVAVTCCTQDRLHEECEFEYLLCDDGQTAVKRCTHSVCYATHKDEEVDVSVIDGNVYIIENGILTMVKGGN